MKPVYIILAKRFPIFLLSIVNVATILALSYFLLKVPIAGEPDSAGGSFHPVRPGIPLPRSVDIDDSRHATGCHAD